MSQSLPALAAHRTLGRVHDARHSTLQLAPFVHLRCSPACARAESSIRGLSCGIGAGLLVGQGASAWLTDSDLSRNEATGQPPLGPAAHAERGAAVRLQQCIFGGNAVPSNATAGATAAAVSLATIEPLPASGAEAEAGALQGAVFSDAPRGTLWVWVVDEQRLTGPLRLVGAQRRGRDGFARPRDESFNRIRQVRPRDPAPRAPAAVLTPRARLWRFAGAPQPNAPPQGSSIPER